MTSAGLLLGAALRAVAHAHGDEAPSDASLAWSDWRLDPAVMAGFVLAAALYLRVTRTSRRRAHVARFWAGLATVFVALQSPLDRGGDHFLFTLHMVQHFLLIMVAAPLLASSLPAAAWEGIGRPGSPGWWVRKALGHGVAVAALFWVNLAVWHLPAFYEAGLQHEVVHALQHLSFLGLGFAFWSMVMAPAPVLGAPLPLRIGLVVGSCIVDWLISFRIAVAGKPLYPTYAAAPRLWGLSALADQSLGGGLMWVADNTVYAVAFAVLLLRYFRRSEGEGDCPPRARPKALGAGPGTVTAIALPLVGALVFAAVGAVRLRSQSPVEVRAVANGLRWYFVYPGPDGRFGRIDPSFVTPDAPAGLDPRDPAGYDDVVQERLVVPAGRPVHLLLTSLDTVHTFDAPALEARAVLVPGRWSSLRLRLAPDAKADVVCTQWCGMAGEPMQTTVEAGPAPAGAFAWVGSPRGAQGGEDEERSTKLP